MKKILFSLLIFTFSLNLVPVAHALDIEQKGTCTITDKSGERTPHVTTAVTIKTECDKKAQPPFITVNWVPICTSPLVVQGNECVSPPTPPTPPDTTSPRDPTYTLLSPLPCPPQSAENQDCANGSIAVYNPTGDNNLSKYLNVIIIIFIGICGVLAVVVIVVGGLEYMTSELPGNKEHGKHRIIGAFGGLIMVFLAWPLLNEINPKLLIADLPDAATVEVDLDADVPQQAVNGKFGTYADKAPWDDTVAFNTPIPAWATVKQPPCTYVGQHGCTSVRGLTGQYLNTIHANCANCEIVITEGSAFWLHGGKTGRTSHGVNSPTVDLRLTSSLTAYIKSGVKTTAHRWSKDGVSFLEEADHWHVGP